jgi:hypothetical protein
MNRTAIIAAFLLAGTSVSAQMPPGTPPAAAPAASAPKVDPAKEADIRKLLDVSGGTKGGEDMIANSIEQLRTNLTRSLPQGDKSPKIVESFLHRFREKFTAEELVAQIVPIYDKYLSDEDIKALIEFYGTPLGQRAVKALPQIARDSQQAELELGQRVVQQVTKEVMEEFPELKGPQKPPGKP